MVNVLPCSGMALLLSKLLNRGGLGSGVAVVGHGVESRGGG